MDAKERTEVQNHLKRGQTSRVLHLTPRKSLKYTELPNHSSNYLSQFYPLKNKFLTDLITCGHNRIDLNYAGTQPPCLSGFVGQLCYSGALGAQLLCFGLQHSYTIGFTARSLCLLFLQRYCSFLDVHPLYLGSPLCTAPLSSKRKSIKLSAILAS